MKNEYLKLYLNSELSQYTNRELMGDIPLRKTFPVIESVSVSPTTTSSHGVVKVKVKAIDKIVTFYETVDYAGELYCGERIGVI